MPHIQTYSTVGRSSHRAQEREEVKSGYYMSYLKGIARGRDWDLHYDMKTDIDNYGQPGYYCILTVTGPRLFTGVTAVEAREFFGKLQASTNTAKEDVAKRAWGLLDNLTNNEKRGHLPKYNAPREKHRQQGQRVSPQSTDSEGSSDS